MANKDFSALNSTSLPSFEPFKKNKFKPDRGRLGLSFLKGLANSGQQSVDLGGGFKAFTPNFAPVANATLGELDRQEGQFAEDEKIRMAEHLTVFKGFLDEAKQKREQQFQTSEREAEEADKSFAESLKRAATAEEKEKDRTSRETIATAKITSKSASDRARKLDLLNKDLQKFSQRIQDRNKKEQEKLDDAETTLIANEIPIPEGATPEEKIRMADIAKKKIGVAITGLNQMMKEKILDEKTDDPAVSARMIRIMSQVPEDVALRLKGQGVLKELKSLIVAGDMSDSELLDLIFNRTSNADSDTDTDPVGNFIDSKIRK